MNFCNQDSASFGSLNNSGSNGSKEKENCACPDSVKYEPLTAEWFKEWGGIIALVITVIFALANK